MKWYVPMMKVGVYVRGTDDLIDVDLLHINFCHTLSLYT